MGKFKDIFSGERGSFFKYAVIVTAAFIVFMTFFSKNSFIRWIDAGVQLRSQRKLIEHYQQEIDRMDSRIKQISNDRDTLEGFARERFGFTKPGDEVFILEN